MVGRHSLEVLILVRTVRSKRAKGSGSPSATGWRVHRVIKMARIKSGYFILRGRVNVLYDWIVCLILFSKISTQFMYFQPFSPSADKRASIPASPPTWRGDSGAPAKKAATANAAAHPAQKMVHVEEFATRSLAAKREAQIKRWPRAKKLSLANSSLKK